MWISAKRARSAGRRTTCAQNSKNTASQPSSWPRRRAAASDSASNPVPPAASAAAISRSYSAIPRSARRSYTAKKTSSFDAKFEYTAPLV